MANQEYPLFALHRGATLLGDVMMPAHRAERVAHATSNPDSAPAKLAPRTLLDRLDAWLWRQRQRNNEAYLAQSQDIFELESRMRALERGANRP